MITPHGLAPGFYSRAALFALCWDAPGTPAHAHVLAIMQCADTHHAGRFLVGANVLDPANVTLHLEPNACNHF